MFSWFKKKRAPNAMDAFIAATYPRGAKKTADLQLAIQLASNDLLARRFAIEDIQLHAEMLNAGPVPYSTHDLAASIALALFRSVPVSAREGLTDVQLTARMAVSAWTQEGKVVPALALAFENALYTDYHPTNLSRIDPFADPQVIRADIAGLVRGALPDGQMVRDLAKPNCAFVLDAHGGISVRWLSESDDVSDVVSFVMLRQLPTYRELLQMCAEEVKAGTFSDAFLDGPGAILIDRVAIEALEHMKAAYQEIERKRAREA
jgi:hypothetical protein